MTPVRGGATCRLLFSAATALSIVGCASTHKASVEAPPTATISVVDYRAWEDAVRLRADDLMAEAQRLVGEGQFEAAVQQTDEALCEVFDAPSGYEAPQVYLDYLGELIDEADEIEAASQHLVEETEAPVDMVVLPPIDVVNVTDQVEEKLETDALPQSDFPLVLNPTVEKFVSAMSSTGEYNTRIAVGLQRSGTYLPMIRDRFEAAGLPVDLSYLPLIESAFSLTAYSRARAHGMWQFISSTARHYGLEVGSLIDERRDPERSTDAAVAYLGDLYQQFGNWQLALAAYNSGAGNVRRAIRRSGSHDFWTLQKYLPRETRNYVPAFIASVIIAKRPDAFGFEKPVEMPWSYESVDVPDALDLQFLASKSGVPIADLRELNPAIRRDLTPARTTTVLRLPPGTADAVRAALEASPRSEWAPRMIHTVRSGDSLYSIARRYGSSVSEIRQANSLRGSLIHPGQNLIVPRFSSGNHKIADRSFSTGSDGTYVVQRNDTLWDIARGFSVSVDSLCEANALSRRGVIRPGQRLHIPTRGNRTANASSRPTQPVSTSGYVVRPGDTLYDIAHLHRVKVADLQRANHLRGSRIHPGDVLQIPSPTESGSAARAPDSEGTYRVKKGDTLFDIARRHGISISALQRANNLAGTRIYPGDVLRIPKSEATG